MNIYLTTLASGVAIVLAVVFAPVWGSGPWWLIPVVPGSIAFLFFFFLKCPRCGVSTWTWRMERKRRSFFNEMILPIPPRRCSYCRLDYLKHRFGEKDDRWIW